MTIRSGYSFRLACGHLKDVVSRVREITWRPEVPICDRNNTFAFTKLTQLAKAAGLRPVYGVELGVVTNLGGKQPITDYWRFMAIDDLRPLHNAIDMAGRNMGREPSLSYAQAVALPGLIKVTGSRVQLDHVPVDSDVYVALGPSTPKGLFNDAKQRGHIFFATSDNAYPRAGDRDLYHVVCGKRSQSQTYPMWILDDEELREACGYADDATFEGAIASRNAALYRCRAELKQASMLIPEKSFTLRYMCEAGARDKNCDLSDPVYAQRLERELQLIKEKGFEDYFLVVADLLQWAKSRMVCGPGRGSSSGSLVCYLLDITSIDPIKHDLVFERFIDVTRSDLPDIDIDLSDKRRELAFQYLEGKYGRERVARLGTIIQFAAKSCLNRAGQALGVPQWLIEEAANNVIAKAKGDEGADTKIADMLEDSATGQKLLKEYPNMVLAGRLEGHPFTRGQHAAEGRHGAEDRPQHHFQRADGAPAQSLWKLDGRLEAD